MENSPLCGFVGTWPLVRSVLRVQVHIPQAVELVMLVPKQGHKKSHTPLVSQVHKVLVDGTCSYQHFHAKVKNKLEHRHSSKMLKGEDMQVMIRLEATPPSTSSLLVRSSTAVLLAMVECKCPPPSHGGHQVEVHQVGVLTHPPTHHEPFLGYLAPAIGAESGGALSQDPSSL